jgi:hypothetical protein
MRGRGWALLALVLGALVALWVFSDQGEPTAPLAQHVDDNSPTDPTDSAAMLEGQLPASPPAFGPDDEATESAGANPSSGGQAARNRPERVTLRLQTPEGEPAPLTKVTVTATSKDGTRAKALVWPVRPDGTVELELILSEVHTLTVRPFSRGRPGATPTLLTWEQGQGSLHTLPPIQVRHAHVLVRTVDSRGDPRPDQRVLFRPREKDAPDPGWSWYGQRSDDEGWLEIGPFPIGARIEMRPGWRGQRGTDLAVTPDKWVEVVAGAEPGALFVGDQPRLVLTFTDRGDEKVLPITVLDPDTGTLAFPTVGVPVTEEAEQTWRAPALKEGKPYEVVVGPTDGGLFARLALEEIPYLEVPIRLTPGVQVEGRVASVPGHELLAGVVHATGRGFRLTAMFSRDGRYRFAGLPEGESVRLHVSARTKGPNGVRMRLSATRAWTNESWLDLQLDEPKPPTPDPVHKVPRSAIRDVTRRLEHDERAGGRR